MNGIKIMDGKLENYELFDKMIGDKFEDTVSITYLRYQLKYLIRYKRHLVRKLKNIRRRRDILSYYNDYDYMSNMGWKNLLLGASVKPINELDLDMVISSLNDDYYKCTLRSIEIELSFLNKNIKKLKKLISERVHEVSDISRVYKFTLDMRFKPCNINKSISNLLRYIKYIGRSHHIPVYVYDEDGNRLIECGSIKSLYIKDGECIFTTYLNDNTIGILLDNDFNYAATLFNPDICTDNNNEIVVTGFKGIVLTKKEDKDE